MKRGIPKSNQRLKRGAQYVNDIERLRKYKAVDKQKYFELFAAIEVKYGISCKTIYRDMKKKVPGLVKTRTDAGKLKSFMPAKARKIVSEVVRAGKTKMEAVKVAEKVTGKRISGRVAQRTKPVDIIESSFGGDVKTFLEEICGYELIAPDAGIKLRHNSFSFIVNKEDLGDIILILTNAYNRQADTAGSDKLPLDKNELFRAKIFQLLEYNIKLAEASADLRSLESITRMYNSIQEDHDLGADFEIVYRICSALKPGISRTEIISLIKQFAK